MPKIIIFVRHPSNKTFTPESMQCACYSSHCQTCPC